MASLQSESAKIFAQLPEDRQTEAFLGFRQNHSDPESAGSSGFCTPSLAFLFGSEKGKL